MYQESVVTIVLVISLLMNSSPGVGSHYWVGDIFVDEQSTRNGSHYWVGDIFVDEQSTRSG